jgi:benzoylformate decarboxylase
VPQDFPVVSIVLVNGKYCILKSFAKLEEAPGVPELDVPNLDMVSLERG